MTALRALRDIVSSPVAMMVGAVAAVAVFLLQVWLPNLGLIGAVVTSGTMSPVDKAGFLWDSLGAIRTNFTVVGAWSAGAISLLFGLNAAATVHYLRRRLALDATGAMGGAGLVAAVLGAGCSACGAVVLSFLFGTATTASFITMLPFRGDEFGLFGVLILAVTLSVALHKLGQPVACAPSGQADDATLEAHQDRRLSRPN
ncbi:MAG: hypothetical protein Kow0010_10900 [Dehalococcoidia bacterium]